MTIAPLTNQALKSANFPDLASYLTFAQAYLKFVDNPANYQAKIIAKNEPAYAFYQYKMDGHYNTSRPINQRLWMAESRYAANLPKFLSIFSDMRAGRTPNPIYKPLVSEFMYTVQQSIGAALDAAGSGSSNAARKLNGELFERFVRLLIEEAGVPCSPGTVMVPFKDPNGISYVVQYQHDLIVKDEGQTKLIGSIKTSSKDRIDKIFMDKYMYSHLTGTDTPHIAIFLNDVQRKQTTKKTGAVINDISTTFLSGKFKAYTINLNPLDGVYYCDIRHSMLTDPLLSAHIKKVDEFFYVDLHNFV